MEIRNFLSEFASYNRSIIKRLILVCIVVLYLLFLILYNFFRIYLGYSLFGSWLLGFFSSLIYAFMLIISVDIIWFYLKKKKNYSARIENKSK